ncbi:MAG TPA: aromatic amino acid transaminase [Allosphingosinicella sp.]|jgi:aromatic-amino-acid transaminase
MFDRFPDPAGDALHAVMARCRDDDRPHKIDLGVGVYRDDSGVSPVMRAVKEAEALLLRSEETKAYQALAGDHDFIDAMTSLVFGNDGAAEDRRIAAIQGTGGTGSLRIALDIAKAASPGLKLHLGLPSWPNHASLAAAAGIKLVTHRYFDVAAGRLDIEAIEAAALAAEEGDLFLFHGPCHNPTGADLTPEQRARLLAILTERGAIPIIDAAYYGLGDGLQQDLQVLRDVAASVPRALIAVACSKSFGLYRERTGILFALCADSAERHRVQGQMEKVSRTLVSMPPAHGAGTVALILGDDRLRSLWEEELAGMRQRMLALRAELAALANAAPMLRGVDRERGIFKMLPLSPEQTEWLGREHAIHMAPSGRINIAGLKRGDASRLAAALADLG